MLGVEASAYSQALSGSSLEEMQTLLDSAEFFQLKAPIRALEFSEVIISQVPEEGNEKLVVRALRIAANSMKMLSERDQALAYASRAVALSRSIEDKDYLLRAFFMKATIFDYHDEKDSSLVLYQQVIDIHEPGMDPYFVSAAYTNVGQIYNSIGSDHKAEEYILKGYRLANNDEYAKLFALAVVISYYIKRDDPRYLAFVDTLAMSDFYKKASATSFLAHFDSFLLLSDASDSEKEQKLREVYAYGKANSSYANQVGFGMKLYEHLDRLGRYDEAKELLEELLQITNRSRNGHHVAGVTRALYENARSRGNLAEALSYLERHSFLRDSLLSDENADRISELNIRFETAQKDREITGQKVSLEQARRNRNFLIVLTSLLLALAVVVFVYFRNRARTARRLAHQEKVIHEQETERMMREKEVAELTASLETQERERNRIARDLHDGLGSLMSGISSQIEYLRAQPSIGENGRPQLVQLREMVNEATSELRRTSYELMPAKLLRQGLEPAIRDLCLNLLVKNGLEPTLEVNTDLSTLDSDQQLTLYRIIQELLNNIVKHADAKNVFLQFSHYDDEISVVVEDDGKGFDVKARTVDGGLGLGSLQSRVNLLKGFLDIASLPGEGTTVTVNFKDKQ
jgi:signal transduction histidine kinase